MQRRVHVFAHARGVATHVERPAALQPVEHLPGVFQKAMLDVDLFLLVARPRDVESGEHSTFLKSFDLSAIKKVCGRFLVAEKQPTFTSYPEFAALFEKSAERRDARARPDHDEWHVRRGRSERIVVMHEYRPRRARTHPVGEKRRADARPRAAKAFVAQRADRGMHFTQMRPGRGGN